jgi:hypothetical protein
MKGSAPAEKHDQPTRRGGLKKTYHGSCHCGAIAYEANLDLTEGTHKCNCSVCTKHRLWQAVARPEDVRIVRGAGKLTEYRFGSRLGVHLFCSTCGTHVLGRFEGELPRGKTVGVRVSTLDNLDIAELLAAPLHIHDGRHGNFEREPEDTRHL